MSHNRSAKIPAPGESLSLPVGVAGLVLLALALAVSAPALAELPHFDARAPSESPSAPPVALLPKAPAWKTLVILAVPADLWNETLQGPDPGKVSPWYENRGREWFESTLAPELREYVLRATYGLVPLDIEVTPWLKLPRSRTEAYVEDRSLEARDALREARGFRILENYRTLIVLDPTSPGSARFGGEWAGAWGKFYPRAAAGTDAIVAGTFYGGTFAEPDPVAATARILAHEIGHAVDFARDGTHHLLDNTGTNFCLHGPPAGGEPWLCPFNEAAVLGIGPRTVGPGEHTLLPVEEGPGLGLRTRAGVSDLFLEFRLAANPKVEGYGEPAVLLWMVRGEQADLVKVFWKPGRSIEAGVPVEVLSMDAGGAGVRLG